MRENSNLKLKRKMKIELILFLIGFLVVSIKLAYIQFIKGKEYLKFFRFKRELFSVFSPRKALRSTRKPPRL